MSRVDWSAQWASSTTTSSGPVLGQRLEQVVDRGEDVAPVERLVLVAVVGGADSRRPGWRRASVG